MMSKEDYETPVQNLSRLRRSLSLARHGLGLLTQIMRQRMDARAIRTRPGMVCTCGAGDACSSQPCHGSPRQLAANPVDHHRLSAWRYYDVYLPGVDDAD